VKQRNSHTCFLLSALILITVTLPLYSKGKEDTREGPAIAEPWTLTLPTEARPGEGIPVIIDGEKTLSDVVITLSIPGEADDPRIQSRGYYAYTTLTGKSRFLAIIPIPADFPSGLYSLSISAKLAQAPVLSATHPLTIVPRQFPNEIVHLNKHNSAIKQDVSPERMAQIRLLNDILYFQDHEGYRFYGPWQVPVTATRRTSDFAHKRTYRYSNGKEEKATHWGIDFGIPTGTPVFASGDGKVVLATFRITTGWTVVIEHLPGLYSLYYHMDSLSCSEGETVRAGTLIGQSGSTGLSTGPHLHWEFRLNGIAMDPDWFVSKTLE